MIRNRAGATTSVGEDQRSTHSWNVDDSPIKPISASARHIRACRFWKLQFIISIVVVIIMILCMTNYGGEIISNVPTLSATIGYSDHGKTNKTERINDGSESSRLTITKSKGGTLPSAKSLLTRTPPFEDSSIVRLVDGEGHSPVNLIHSPNTVVTGYFRVPSKYNPDKYDGWMTNMLSLQDAMVIFTQPDLVDQIKTLRSHAVNRTVIVPLALDDLPFGTLYPNSFWQDQLDRDPEQRRHKSYQLFWIWLSKSWCVVQAIRMNVFHSDLFVWSDIGCFRDGTYNYKTMVLHRDSVPPHEMIQMAHHRPNPPRQELFNDKYKHKANFYHSGSQMAGFDQTWQTFHQYFLETIDRFLEKDMIIVEDQAVLQSTCLSHPDICAYVPFNQVKDNHYFGLRFVLHYGGEYKYWRHSKSTT